MVAIIDYDTGNLQSVRNALSRIGAQYVVTADHGEIGSADHVLLPGVGEASTAMERLRARGLDTLLPQLTQPVLGICIGLQLMCQSSEEGDAKCMGIFDTSVRRLHSANLKIPHVGWDTVQGLRSPIFAGIPEDAYFYYVHSYAADLCSDTAAVTDYARKFSAALCRDNFYGVQFHPEKSGTVGELLLKNFLSI